MKKVIGWILVICGILSLPSLIQKLSTARHTYEVIGMLVGQGLIFFLAYLCFKNRKIESESKNQNVYNETKDTSSSEHRETQSAGVNNSCKIEGLPQKDDDTNDSKLIDNEQKLVFTK